MAIQGPLKFADLKDRAWRAVHDLSKSLAAKPLPVRLDQIAASYRIQQVQFEPLISTAGLAKYKDGFSVFLNTEAPGVCEAPGTILGTNDEKWLKFPPSVRFTLAHEVAHVIFIDAAGVKSTNELFRRNHSSLESTCSEMARTILLPASRLLQELRGKPFDAANVRDLLSLFQVSPEVLVRRMNLPDMRKALSDLDGLLAFAREDKGRIRIVAYQTWGPYAPVRFGSARRSPTGERNQSPFQGNKKVDGIRDKEGLEGCTLEELYLGPEAENWLRSDVQCQTRVDVPWSNADELPCKLTACQVTRQPLGFLLGIRVCGHPQARSAKI